MFCTSLLKYGFYKKSSRKMIWKKKRGKKVFNWSEVHLSLGFFCCLAIWSEVHLSEVTSYKIHTLHVMLCYVISFIFFMNYSFCLSLKGKRNKRENSSSAQLFSSIFDNLDFTTTLKC